MKNSNLVGLAAVAVTLFLLAVVAVHLNPALAGVIGAILIGIAAIITAINRHRIESTDNDVDGNEDAADKPDGAGPKARNPEV